MSVHDDSSTVLSVRGSEASGPAPDTQTDKINDIPDFYSKSPYTDSDIISLDVGLSKTRYRIHRTILAQSPELASKPALKLWGEKTHDTVALPELDPVTAHTLVTYLYTGRYSTLAWLGTPSKATLAAYKLSTCVYCAATRYKIPALAALAQEEIEALGAELSIFEILGVAREHAFPILPAEEESWFAGYLAGAIKGAVKADAGLIVRPEFVDQIEGDRKFRQVVMEAIVSTYSSGAVGVEPPGQGDDGKGVEREEKAEEEKAAERDAGDADVKPSAEVQLDDIEPTISESPLHRPATPLSPRAPESVTDELDFKNSKTYQSMGRPATHVRHDSVQADEAVAAASVAKTEVVTSPAEEAAPATAEVVSPPVEATNEAPVSLKNKKKKKGKKGSGTSFAGVPA